MNAEVPATGLPTAASPEAPPAVAVLLRAEGLWADTHAALTALRAQDYGRLALLVLCDPDGPKAQQIRSAFGDVPISGPRSTSKPTSGSASESNNRGASLVRGADWFVFTSDRVSLAPNAVSLLVADAAAAEGVVGVVGPKLVDALDGRTLRDLGGSADRLGVKIPTAGADEMDQAQHDEARDLFVAPTEAMAVRAELFSGLGGFDPLLDGDGAAVDLCWRAQLAGERVRVVPAATGALRPAHSSDQPGAPAGASLRQRQYRARLRTLLKCYGWVHLLPVVALAALSGLAEALFAVVRGRFAQASDVALAWLWNLRHLTGTLMLRRAAKRSRRVRDADVRRMQQGGSARLTDWLRYRLSPEGSQAARISVDESILGTWRRSTHRTVWVGWLAVLGLIAFGSRSLLLGGVAAYGQFAAFGSAGELTGAYLDGWRSAGLGEPGIGHPALGLLGLGATLLGGAAGLLRHLAIWGLLVVGLVGIWKLCSVNAHGSAGQPSSRSGRLVALALYAACPLPYGAVAVGRWDVLLAYACAPLIVLLICRLVSPPGPQQPARRTSRGTFARVAALGLLLSVVAAFEPFIVALAVGAGVVLAGVALVRALVVGPNSGAAVWAPLAGLAGVLGAAAWAGLAHLPWISQFGSLREWAEASVGRAVGEGPTSLAALLRFETESLGGTGTIWGTLPWGPMSWGLAVAAALALLVARGDRFWWTLRGWLLALVGFGAAWAIVAGYAADLLDSQLGWLSPAASLAEVSLAFAAVGLCWAATALGGALAAENADAGTRVRGLALLASTVAVGAMVVPTVWASLDGRWGAPEFDLRVPLGLIDDRDVGADYRVLWLGRPEVMPLAGWDIGPEDGDQDAGQKGEQGPDPLEGLTAGTSIRGYPDVRQAWAVPSTDGVERLIDALRVGLRGDTLRLGRLLAPFGIRYVVLLERSGPSYSPGIERPVAPEAAEALASQIDLRPLAADPAVMVFQNEAWWSSRAQFERPIPPGFGDHPLELVVSDLTDGIGVLTDYRSPTSQLGHLGSGPLLVADTFDRGWRLRVGDREVSPVSALGWAMQFQPPYAGQAELSFERAAADGDLMAAQVLIWLAMVWVAVGQPFPLVNRVAAALGRLHPERGGRRRGAA